MNINKFGEWAVIATHQNLKTIACTYENVSLNQAAITKEGSDSILVNPCLPG